MHKQHSSGMEHAGPLHDWLQKGILIPDSHIQRVGPPQLASEIPRGSAGGRSLKSSVLLSAVIPLQCDARDGEIKRRKQVLIHY
jgi:hypothetical protein